VTKWLAAESHGGVFLTDRGSDWSKPVIESKVSRPVGSLEPVKASVHGAPDQLNSVTGGRR
jgi:hypothetical protein